MYSQLSEHCWCRDVPFPLAVFQPRAPRTPASCEGDRPHPTGYTDSTACQGGLWNGSDWQALGFQGMRTDLGTSRLSVGGRLGLSITCNSWGHFIKHLGFLSKHVKDPHPQIAYVVARERDNQ